MSANGTAKVVLTALIANLLIATAKFIGAFFSGSASLMAEAIHSLVDCINQALLHFGHRASQKPATEQHPLGFGREAFFYSFIVACLLFSLGGVFAIAEGIHKIEHPESPDAPWLGLGILAVSTVLEAISFRACLREVRNVNEHGSLWNWFKKSTSADLLVVFMEDAAALVGLVLAASSLTLTWLTGNPVWDAIGSVCVGGLLVVVAFFLAKEIKSLLIGEAPNTDFRPAIEEILQECRRQRTRAIQSQRRKGRRRRDSRRDHRPS